MNPGFWQGRRVFVTGHTGFKGSWLCLWLQHAGAQVHGYALPPPTRPNLFTEASVQQGMHRHTLADVRDAAALRDAMHASAPEVVLHLAAQPLVRHSYVEPVETYATNVMGTVHLLEAVRACPSVRAVLNVTTDKCYENREWVWGYRESDALGGRDPYSSSKACSELVTAAYRASFLGIGGLAVASARAGNVIGGGDWAEDRLLPDFFRAHDEGRSVEIRHPDATRPWQHVLEPLSGYLILAEHLVEQGQAYASAWNFGPGQNDAQPVRWILDKLSDLLPGAAWRHVGGTPMHESNLLRLDSARAAKELNWSTRWDLERALRATVDWHRAWRQGQDMRSVSLHQIDAFTGSVPV
jgi:CDP-glucose 4,6-dehydratase